jgi:hypothetical protein
MTAHSTSSSLYAGVCGSPSTVFFVYSWQPYYKDVYNFFVFCSSLSLVASTREFEFALDRSASVKSHTYDICCCSFPHCRN